MPSNLQPMYVVCCENAADAIFQQAASLMQETLHNAAGSSDDVVYTSTSLENPSSEDLGEVAGWLAKFRIFNLYGHFRLAEITDAPPGNIAAIGVGSNNKKLDRAAKLALAVAVAMQRGHSDEWLREHGISIKLLKDPSIPKHVARARQHKGSVANCVSQPSLQQGRGVIQPPRSRSRSATGLGFSVKAAKPTRDRDASCHSGGAACMAAGLPAHVQVCCRSRDGLSEETLVVPLTMAFSSKWTVGDLLRCVQDRVQEVPVADVAELELEGSGGGRLFREDPLDAVLKDGDALRSSIGMTHHRRRHRHRYSLR